MVPSNHLRTNRAGNTEWMDIYGAQLPVFMATHYAGLSVRHIDLNNTNTSTLKWTIDERSRNSYPTTNGVERRILVIIAPK